MPSLINLEHSIMPMKVGDIATCPYGIGKVTSIREGDDMLVITPSEWKLANGCVPTFYIKQTAPPHTPQANKEIVQRGSYMIIDFALFPLTHTLIFSLFIVFLFSFSSFFFLLFLHLLFENNIYRSKLKNVLLA